jgi:hypothetical protein
MEELKKAISVISTYKSFGGLPIGRNTITFSNRKRKSANRNIIEAYNIFT